MWTNDGKVSKISIHRCFYILPSRYRYPEKSKRQYWYTGIFSLLVNVYIHGMIYLCICLFKMAFKLFITFITLTFIKWIVLFPYFCGTRLKIVTLIMAATQIIYFFRNCISILKNRFSAVRELASKYYFAKT